MNDPSRPPGFEFTALRLLRAQYENLSDVAEGSNGELAINFADSVDIKDRTIVVRQNVLVRVLDPTDKSKVFLQAMVEVEGKFAAAADANIDMADFASNHAPAILFPFTREWIHRLTSAAGPWPPILLPPVNVLQLRKQNAGIKA